MNTPSLPTLCLAVAAVALTGCTTGSPFKRADTNNDGEASFSEFDAYMKEAIFNGVDTNGDGKVSQEEWRKVNPKDSVSEFKKTDLDGDGFITRAEADAAFDKEGSLKDLFKKMDTDKSGSISEAEAKAFEAMMKKQPGKNKLEKLENAATQ